MNNLNKISINAAKAIIAVKQRLILESFSLDFDNFSLDFCIFSVCKHNASFKIAISLLKNLMLLDCRTASAGEALVGSVTLERSSSISSIDILAKLFIYSPFLLLVRDWVRAPPSAILSKYCRNF